MTKYPTVTNTKTDWDICTHKINNKIKLHLALKTETDVEEAVQHLITVTQCPIQTFTFELLPSSDTRSFSDHIKDKTNI